MSDYPEHLNPFREDELVSERKKRSGSFSNTLKGFTNTLRKSFRSKSKHRKEDVEIRNSTLRTPTARPMTYSPPATQTLHRVHQGYSPALPRSRFRERLAKSHIAALSEKELDETNPFKDEEARDVVVDLNITPIERPKRRKKRAPPPPGGSDSNHLQVPNSSSNWSLASGETDASYSTYAPSEFSEAEDPPEPLEESEEVKQVVQEFNRDMKKLTDDTNNNVIVVDEDEKTDENEQQQSDIPTVSREETEEPQEKQKTTEISSRVAEIVRQLESTTDDEKCRSLSNKSDEITANGFLEDDDDGLRKKKPTPPERTGTVALAEPEDSDLDTPPRACSTPVPKVRKNKLARGEMLGYEA